MGSILTILIQVFDCHFCLSNFFQNQLFSKVLFLSWTIYKKTVLGETLFTLTSLTFLKILLIGSLEN